jgi:alkyl hydroperoxide reductase subunit D
MSFKLLYNIIPEYANDISHNLKELVENHEGLSDSQFAGSILVAAIASKNEALIAQVHKLAASILTEIELKSAYAATSLMAMTNIYYRFVDLVSDKSYLTMPAGLRMNILKNHGGNNLDFEMWALVVSVINGCHRCTEAHEQALIKQHNVTKKTIQLLAKIAALIHSVATTQEIERFNNASEFLV